MSTDTELTDPYPPRTDAATNLGIGGTERVARFLLHHMDMDTRGKLMGQCPVDYAVAYPTVDVDSILERVRREIEMARQS